MQEQTLFNTALLFEKTANIKTEYPELC